MSSPKIICKSGYITSAQHVLNSLEYAGNKIEAQMILFWDGSTMEADEDTRIALTQAQRKSVSGIRLTYKDGGSKVITYEAYEKLTQERRSVITVEELELVEDEELLVNEDGKAYHRTQDLNFFSYLGYIEGRPGVEKSDGHGLFGLTGDVSIADAQTMAMEYKDSRKWSHIISLETEGAKRTGFDRRDMWAALIRSKAPVIAKAYNISLENLVINCAFHGNTDNPHVHLLFYSKDHREGFVKGGKEGMQVASETLKSTLLNTIFRDDVEPLKQEKTRLRDAMALQIRQHLESIQTKDYSHTPVARQLLALSHQLEVLPGKKVYGYLPPEVKGQVNRILREIILQDANMQGLYAAYLDAQKNFVSQYVAKPEKIQASIREFDQCFFEPGKTDLKLCHNAIVKAALELGQAARGKVIPPPRPRATKEKIWDSTMLAAPPSITSDYFSFSSDENGIPVPSDEDIPPPADWDAPVWEDPEAVSPLEPSQKSQKRRATKEKIWNSTRLEAVLSTADTRRIVNNLFTGIAMSLLHQTQNTWQNTKGEDKKQAQRAKRKLRHKRRGIAQEQEYPIGY